jgi:hypothetical protein
MQTPVIPHDPVILSGAKDPVPASAATSPAKSFKHVLAVKTGYWVLGTGN